jgi:hypothetical protein
MAKWEKGKHPGGRPPYVPTEEQRKMVEAMTSFGVTQIEVCTVLGIDKKTLNKYYREELDRAHIKANAKVAANLFRQATKDDFRSTTAAIFWAKTRMGWKEPVHVEATIKSYESMSDAELVALITGDVIEGEVIREIEEQDDDQSES